MFKSNYVHMYIATYGANLFYRCHAGLISVFLGSIAVRNAGFGEGSNTSILLDDLLCTGDESSLLDCVTESDIGVHDCDHSEDAGVRCDGTYFWYFLCIFIFIQQKLSLHCSRIEHA